MKNENKTAGGDNRSKTSNKIDLQSQKLGCQDADFSSYIPALQQVSPVAGCKG